MEGAVGGKGVYGVSSSFIKTKSGKFLCRRTERVFCNALLSGKICLFSPEKSSGFIKVVDALSRLNTATKNLAVIKDKQTERPEKLAVLLVNGISGEIE